LEQVADDEVFEYVNDCEMMNLLHIRCVFLLDMAL